MVNIFQELLDSYDKLKKRTLVINLDEAAKPLDPQSEQKAKSYISQATSKSNQPPPNNKVAIPELGGAQIWVAVEGKSAGNIVFNGFSGPRQGKALPLSSDVKQGTNYQNYVEFVNMFGGGSQTEDPSQQQLVEPTVTTLPSTNPEIQKSLMKAFRGTIDLILGNFFLQDKDKPAWMEEGPEGMFKELGTKFTLLPGSLEQKLNKSFGLMYDKTTETLLKVPVSEYDKEIAAKTFEKFVSVCSKFKDGTFNEEDAVWVSHHVVADKNGLWFKDPIRLDYGVAFDWNNSYTQLKDKFFTNMVESYNRAYEEWSETKRTSPLFTIKFQTLRPIPIAYRTNDLNDIRGKTAEELQIAIHHLATGNNDEFRKIVANLKDKFGKNLVDAYNYGQSFQQEQNVGTQQLAGYQELVDNLSKLSSGQMVSTLDEAIFNSVLKRLFRIEAKGMLIRNPKTLEHVGKNVAKGLKADVIEGYSSKNEAVEAFVNCGFGAKEVTGMVMRDGKVPIGIKTAIVPGEVKMGAGSIEGLINSLKGKQDQGFMTKMTKELGILSKVTESKVNEAVESIHSAMDKIDVGMSKVSNPKTDQGVLRRQTLDMLNSIVRKQFGFNDLISVDNFNDFDLDNEGEMDKLKGYVKRKLIANMIRKNLKEGKKEYGAFLALAMCSNGCAQQNQVTNVRFLSTEESIMINHNEAIQQAARNLMEGTYTLDQSNSSTLSIMDERGVPTVKLGLSRAKQNSNVATVSMSLSYLRSIGKKPNHVFTENLMYKFLKGQQELLEGILKTYPLKKKSLGSVNKSSNS